MTSFESLDETIPGLEGEVTLDFDQEVDLQLTRVEHYVLLHRLGQGGMGVVYAAYDEKLDRKVAIKLLRRAASSRPRLEREAQAMARLSHPNVVQVYEIGDFEGVPFIVMEFVDGETLKAWQRSTRRSQAEILAVFAAAGRGLVAAHDKGLVHRDFKPDNVMVSRDGRVLVMDFGLARGDDHEDALDLMGIERSTSAIPGELTATGAIMGTPAYMAPEQFIGGGSGPHTDQFSFCVTLWEALCGARPFAGTNVFALQDAITHGRISDPEPRELPTWLRRVLERGLAPDPEERWPSMTALLVALADDPTRRRRWLGRSLAALLVLVGGGRWGVAAFERHQAETAAAQEAAARASCAERSQALAEVWSPDTRERLAETFATTKRGFSGEAWTRTEARLDDYAQAWLRLREQVCVETEVEGSRDLRSAERRLRCLDERRAGFEALLDAWASVDDEMVTRAPAAAAELPLISMCTNEAWLAQQLPPPDDEATRAAVLDLRVRLEQVAARGLAADYDTAHAEALAVLAEAEALGWSPLVAEARFAMGDLQEHRGQLDEAHAQLRRAFFEAGDAGHDLVALQTASKLAWTVGVVLQNYEQGRMWGDLGAMFVARMGLDGTIHEAKLLNAVASIEYREGRDIPTALATYRRAMEIRRAELGPDHPLVAASLNNIGLLQGAEGMHDEGLASLRRSYDIRLAAFGPEHPSVAASLGNLSLTLEQLGRHAEALDASLRALAILEHTLGPEHPAVGRALSNLGVVQESMGAYEDALESHRRGLEIKLATYGPDHATIALSLANIGEAQRRLGDLEGARDSLERALAVRDQASRPPAQRAKNLFSLAQVLGEAGELRRALELARAAAKDYGEAGEAGEAQAEKLAEVEAWIEGGGVPADPREMPAQPADEGVRQPR
jgi:tetratricopeptide (TPR) repeat protein/tRNA A-37 threonylcarbamoyl transferase component Bud32